INMTKITTYSIKGVKGPDTTLPKEITGSANLKLLAQAVRVYENNIHTGVSKAKTRGEVVASKKKIYRQKGTGRARHGAISAPIFVGGGKAHGPDGLNKILSISKKMKQKALISAISLKVKSNSVFVISGVNTLKKTKEAANLLAKILEKNTKNCIVALAKGNSHCVKFFRNIEGVKTIDYSNLNAHQVYLSKNIILDKDAFETKKEKPVKK